MEFNIKKSGTYDTPIRRDRVSWPWRKMDVGDMVEIPSDLASRGQVNCHMYGRTKGWKFSTYTDANGVLHVTRTH